MKIQSLQSIPYGWSIETLESLTPKDEKFGIVDGPFGSNLKTIHYQTEGIPIITSGYVTNGYFYADKYLYVTKEKFNQEKRSAVKGGDIVMAKIGARCGSSAIFPYDHQVGILSGNALKITIDETRYRTMYIWQILLSSYRNNKLDALRSVGAQPALSMASLKKYKLLLPPLPEQNRIVSVFETWDQSIEKLTKKIEIKKQIKKGLMQDLLTGKKRLNGFYGKWVMVKLSDVAINLDNKRIPLNSEDRDKRKGDIPYCGANGIVDYVDGHIFDEDIILVAEDGGQFDEYKTRPIAYRMKTKCWVNNHAHVIKAKENFSHDLLFYLTVHKDILQYLNGGTRAKLNKSELLKIKYFVSTDKKEQQAIANILNTLDNEINFLKKKLSLVRDQKQYLLNNLITGTIRTPETLSVKL